MKEFFETVAGVFGIILGVILSFALIVSAIAFVYGQLVDKPACANFGKMSNMETYYSFATDCLVKRDGEWVLWKYVVGAKQEIIVKGK